MIKKITNFDLSRLPVYYWSVIIAIGILLKLLVFPVRLGDYNSYLLPWINFIKSHGYFSSLQYNFYNYSPSYIYILILIAKAGLSPLYAIKIVSVLFEYILSYFVGKILFIKSNNKTVLWLSFALLPLLPTIFLNGAFWGQCDVIYATFSIASFYFIIREKSITSIILLAIVFTFKAQTLFIFPFYFLLMIKGRIKWYTFLIIPIVYFLSVLPVWLQGRSLSDLLIIYLRQSDYYHALTIFMPNIYIWLEDINYTLIKNVGIVFTVIFVLFTGFLIKKKMQINNDNLILLAFASVMITPFILPGMHERYLYLSDIMAFIYIFWFNKNLKAPLSILIVSLYAYICCSRLKTILPLWPGFILYVYALFQITSEIRRRITPNSKITK